MAKFTYLFQQSSLNHTEVQRKIASVLTRPGQNTPYIKKSPNEFLWLSNEKGIELDEWNMTFGQFSEDENQFTLKVVINEDEVSIASDLVGSRTVWYYIGHEQIIVSSSQRSIIKLLGDFQLNEQAVSWMFCTGCLGPGNSWDKRIKCLSPNETITIQKSSLELKSFMRGSTSIDKPLGLIFDEVFSAFRKNRHYGITLSGGWDSRAVAWHLREKKKDLESISWGISGSNLKPETDAQIAEEVAKELGLKHSFIPLQKTDPQIFMDQFIRDSEGRTDHIHSFSDGMDFWRQLAKKPLEYVIRADEAFGWLKVNDDQSTRISLDLNTPEDFRTLKDFFETGLTLPTWPNEFDKKGETLATWRDRLYRNYRIPYILAALQDPMLSYIEIVNPLLHSDFIEWSIAQKDEDRTDKSKYRKHVKSLLPHIPPATIPSIPEVGELLAEKGAQSTIKKQLSFKSQYFNLSSAQIQFLKNQLQAKNSAASESVVKRRIKNLLPFWVKKMIRKNITGYQLSGNRLAFRGYIVMKTMEIIETDLSN